MNVENVSILLTGYNLISFNIYFNNNSLSVVFRITDDAYLIYLRFALLNVFDVFADGRTTRNGHKKKRDFPSTSCTGRKVTERKVTNSVYSPFKSITRATRRRRIIRIHRARSKAAVIHRDRLES